LIVDDEPAVLGFVSRMVRDGGYEVLSATSPQQALEIIQNEPPIDLVLSDIMMPEMRGTELIRKIAEISPKTSALLMSGGVLGPMDVPPDIPLIRKPLMTPELLQAIEALLQRPAGGRADNPKATGDGKLQRKATGR
jgi:CheY-like chemotaxis protein